MILQWEKNCVVIWNFPNLVTVTMTVWDWMLFSSSFLTHSLKYPIPKFLSFPWTVRFIGVYKSVEVFMAMTALLMFKLLKKEKYFIGRYYLDARLAKLIDTFSFFNYIHTLVLYICILNTSYLIHYFHTFLHTQLHILCTFLLIFCLTTV